jgi:hypothetical protein
MTQGLNGISRQAALTRLPVIALVLAMSASHDAAASCQLPPQYLLCEGHADLVIYGEVVATNESSIDLMTIALGGEDAASVMPGTVLNIAILDAENFEPKWALIYTRDLQLVDGHIYEVNEDGILLDFSDEGLPATAITEAYGRDDCRAVLEAEYFSPAGPCDDEDGPLDCSQTAAPSALAVVGVILATMRVRRRCVGKRRAA